MLRCTLHETNFLRPLVAPGWTEACLANMDAVLCDHAHCEKKAAVSALSLINSYPQHDELVRRAAALAQEEMRHFAQVHRLVVARGLTLTGDKGDPYVHALRRHMRHGLQQHFMDRLLVSALIEARSCERLQQLGEALATATLPEQTELAPFYRDLAKREAGHARLFVRLAQRYLDKSQVAERLMELAELEFAAIASVPVSPRIH